ncbi:MAG: Ig-like domain-containing protein [Methanobacteriaceae archaeon]|nr:Ig-like domain-containing protein [Methanobacteriaceae archaeon]
MHKTLKLVLLIFISLFLYSLIGAASAANTYIVNDSSYSTYFNTTGYINNTNVQAGDVLDLSGTIKNKNMYINRPLNITSSTKTAQILNGTITILPGGSGTNITDLKINNSNVDGIGIFLNGTENNTIKGNKIHCNGSNGFGIALTDSNHNYILNNTVITTQRSDVERTHTAVVLGSSSYNTIGNNTVKSDGADCIYLSYYSSDSGNFKSNGPSNNNSIINNTCIGVDTDWCYAIQIGASAGSNNTVEKNKILSQTFPEKKSSYGIGAKQGISSNDDEGNTIKDNIISATYYGIYASSNCIVSGNTISNYGSEDPLISGIFIAKNNCIVTNNTINMSSGYGIYLTGSNCNITGNKITTNGTQESIYLYAQINNIIIEDNTINSKNTGILLKKQSSTKYPTQITIKKNHITTSNTYAINSSEGTNNTITSNYLISDGGNKLGDEAINPGTGDSVNENMPASVILTPVPGYYKNSIQVTLTINRPVTIYYTTNGSTPTNQSTLYTTPISITQTTTLKYITVDEEGNNSPVQTKTYTIDTTPPTVTSVDPTNNKVINVANKALVITFSENIKAGSAFTSIKVTNPDGVSVKPLYKVINGKTLTLTRNGNYINGLTYTITLPTNSITDTAGNTLKTAYTSKFAVDFAKPTVTRVNPANNKVINVANKALVITFSENIKAGSAFTSIKVTNPDGVSVKPLYKVINGKTLTLTRNGNYINGLTYTITLPTNSITDTAGNTLATAFTSKFKIDTTRPTVASVDPANNKVINVANKALVITFSENIKAGSAFTSIKVTNPDRVSVKPLYKVINGKTLTLTRNGYYINGLTYTITLPTGSITDTAGNPINTYTSKFKIDTTRPKITSVNPANAATKVARNKTIKVNFNENIKASNNYRIELKANNGTLVKIGKSIIGKTLTITHTARLKANTKYTLTLYTGSVTDTAGNPLAAKTITFTTGNT